MRRPEEGLHRSCVQLLSLYEARGLLAFCHPYNGGFRTKAEAGIGRALGVKAGVPDLLMCAADGRSIGVELKAGAGKLSPAQLAWHGRLADLGHRVHVVRSLDGLEMLLRAEGVPPVGTLAISADVPEWAQ